ncbi:MAG: NADH-quinone oxidoreductase subunit L [Chloroflexi bacterium]|nr:NADH-quinone oxidoreductase subunit L [Chloroflexota bacterium]
MQEFFFNISWLIPLFPFVAFFVIILFTQGNRKLSHSISIASMGISWLIGWGVAFSAFTTAHLEEHPIHFHIDWFPIGSTWFQIGTWIDPLSAIMLFMVPFVCLMIFIYAVGYMGYGTDEVDPNYSRFFAYISLFAAGMLGLVVSENLLSLFISWEIMGLCSYLLIGFWIDKNYPDPDQITPREAGLKAFLVTKIGDLFLLLGILYLHSQTGSLSYDVVFSHGVLQTLAENMVTLPLLGTWSAASLIALLIFGGVVGKSAQFPLHVWLPDAMEGPTPVSALIHAATMVSAGVFLVVRIFPLLNIVVEMEHHNPAMGFIAFIGAFTAFFSSTIAVAQDDIKGVLAYSTISQLGYMIAALGVGAYVAGAFHLITHAFFKALLFLGSGSVIIGCHHEQDMMEMGGLREKMPITFWTFVAGGFALSGFPIITAGFWSKDEILAHAWHEFLHEGVVSWPFFVWLLLTLAAFLTAFYTGRQIWLTFLGKPRGHHAEHAHETPFSMTVPLMMLAFFALTLGFVGIPEEIVGHGNNWFHGFIGHEYPATPLSVPVMLLSALLAVGGLFLSWLVYGRKPLAHGEMDPLERGMQKIKLGWLYVAMRQKFYFDEIYQATFVQGSIKLADIFYQIDYFWVIEPIVRFVAKISRLLSKGTGIFDTIFIDKLVNMIGRVGVIFSDFLGVVDNKVLDGIVNSTGRGGVLLSFFSGLTDNKVIDGIVNRIAEVTGWIGVKILRPIQTGKVQNYLLVVLVTILALLGLYLVY